MVSEAINVIPLILGVLTLLIALVPNFFEVRTKNDDGTIRVTRVGRLMLALAAGAFLLDALADGFKTKKDAVEKATIQRVSQAQADSMTRRLERLIMEAEAIKRRSLLQAKALDSVSTITQRLIIQQRIMLHDLDASLTLSNRIADSLHLTVAVSRQTADSLRAFESRGAERTLQMQDLINRRSNPLTHLSGTVSISVRKRNTSAGMLDHMYQLAYPEGSSWPPNKREIFGGITFETYLPSEIIFHFYHADDCERSFAYERVFASATHRPLYNRGQFEPRQTSDSSTSFLLYAKMVPFELRSSRSVSVEELHGSCLYIDLLGPAPGIGSGTVHEFRQYSQWWDEVEVSVYMIQLPQGRIGYASEVPLTNRNSRRFMRVFLSQQVRGSRLFGDSLRVTTYPPIYLYVPQSEKVQ